MWSPDRFVLFLGSHSSDELLSHLASLSGLSLVAAPWQQCQVSGSKVSVRGAFSYRGGTRFEYPGTLTFAPALIAVLAPTRPSLQVGERLAYACHALWGHCSNAARLTWPSWATKEQQGEGVLVEYDPRSPTGLTASAPWASVVVGTPSAAQAIEISPLTSQVLAPCGVLTEGPFLIDGFASNAPDPAAQQRHIVNWLNTAVANRTQAVPAVTLTSGPFPEMFETSRYIDTEYVSEARALYIDPSLQLDPADQHGQDRTLARLIARRRSNRLYAATEDLREIETGVGRACLVEGLRAGQADLVDFTVLGIGVTPYSEGGFVEVGRKIDGKATVRRGWHRKDCADRLEDAGCRAGRVLAMYEVPGEGVQMLDGTVSPEALILRAFRSTYRVKNLDPLICALHSTQHTPLVHAYVAERALELHRSRGGHTLDEPELAQALSRWDASQESLRLLVQGEAPSPFDTSAAAVVRQARLDVIAAQTPPLMEVIFERLAQDLQLPRQDVTPTSYLRWFARCTGRQLARWRQMRFLYDYHHPGVSRWTLGHIYTLGENNVSLLAEFPDLDTGTFVDDPDDKLLSILQLPPEDIPVLRSNFDFFHQREIIAAKTVLETLTALLYHSYGYLDVAPLNEFDETYHAERFSDTAVAE